MLLSLLSRNEILFMDKDVACFLQDTDKCINFSLFVSLISKLAIDKLNCLRIT